MIDKKLALLREIDLRRESRFCTITLRSLLWS